MSWLWQLVTTFRRVFPAAPEHNIVENDLSTNNLVSLILLQVLGEEIDGWYNVQLADGKRGLVPSTYIEIKS